MKRSEINLLINSSISFFNRMNFKLPPWAYWKPEDCRDKSSQTLAESARSLYFFGKMLGTFGETVMLTKLSPPKFLIWSTVIGLFSILALFVIPNEMMAYGVIFIIGLGISNIFPLIFSLTIARYPSRSNEISGLIIMSISGGAVIPLLMGWIGDLTNIVTSVFVLVAGIGFILLASLYNLKKFV